MIFRIIIKSKKEWMQVLKWGYSKFCINNLCYYIYEKVSFIRIFIQC